jgi:hypothetical protein
MTKNLIFVYLIYFFKKVKFRKKTSTKIFLKINVLLFLKKIKNNKK